MQVGKPPIPYEGWLDLNLNLNFAPQMRKEYLDFLYTTRDMALTQLYDIQWWAVAGVAFASGLILATLIACLFAAWGRRRATSVAILVAVLLTPVLSYAQPSEPMVDLTTLGYVKKNLASRINNAGCCVFASQDGSFRSQYASQMDGYLEYVAQNLPGGGYPSRVTEYMEAFCRARNIPVPDYTQIVGEESLAAIREALEDGRSPAVTYSGDPAFYGGPVPHMVNCVYLDDQWAGVVDNNRPGQIEWLSASTFAKRHRHFDRGWAIVYHGKPQVPRPVATNPRAPRRDFQTLASPFRLAVNWQCPTCPPSQRFQTPTREPPTDDIDISRYEWRDNALYRDGCRIGEMHQGRYHIYRGDGRGRSWLEPAECPVRELQTSGTPTGVDYSHIPKPLRGQTLYGSASSDLRYDDAGRKLFSDRMTGDRVKPRIIINIDGAEDVVRDILRRIAALERVFVYARDAIEVIRRLGYGPGITVVSGTDRGVAVETAYFETVPSDAELREALIKADPSYKPGSSGVGSVTDYPALGLLLVIAVLAVGILIAVNRKAGDSDV